MKKLFISVPMRGRTDEQIKRAMTKMKAFAEAKFGEELEVIPTHMAYPLPELCKEPSLYYLGQSISKLSYADYYIGIQNPDEYRGCVIENMAAESYGVETTYILLESIMED